MEKYYLLKDEVPTGPYTLEELRELKLPLSSLVWYKGVDKWTEARLMPELYEIADTVEIPPTPPTAKPSIHVDLQTLKDKPISREEIENKSARVILSKLRFLKYALLIGLLSVPVFFILNDGLRHHNMIKKWADYEGMSVYDYLTKEGAYEKRQRLCSDLIMASQSLGVSSGGENYKEPSFSSAHIVRQHTMYRGIYLKEALESALYTLIVSFFILSIGEYFYHIFKRNV